MLEHTVLYEFPPEAWEQEQNHVTLAGFQFTTKCAVCCLSLARLNISLQLKIIACIARNCSIEEIPDERVPRGSPSDVTEGTSPKRVRNYSVTGVGATTILVNRSVAERHGPGIDTCVDVVVLDCIGSRSITYRQRSVSQGWPQPAATTLQRIILNIETLTVSQGQG